jgi:hypothetical protein
MGAPPPVGITVRRSGPSGVFRAPCRMAKRVERGFLARRVGQDALHELMQEVPSNVVEGQTG